MPRYKLRGVNVDFPYKAYECQLVYMEKVIASLQQAGNALLESPTGTGKTLCLLCAVLAWRRHFIAEQKAAKRMGNDGSEFGGEVPTVYYSSRTHSQLSQAVRELKRTTYKPRVTLLASREHMCIHERVSKMEGALVRDHACRQLVVVKKHACDFERNLELFERSNANYVEEIHDMEDLVTNGKLQKFCPFYLSRHTQNDADVVFLPYNYLVDPQMRSAQNIKLENAIIIFDEAHNLDSFLMDAASFELSSVDLTSAMSEIDRAITIIEKPEYNGEMSTEDMLILKELISRFEALLYQLPLTDNQFVERGRYAYRIFEEVGVTAETYSRFAAALGSVTSLLLEDSERTNVQRRLSVKTVQSALELLFRENTSLRMSEIDSAYRFVVTSEAVNRHQTQLSGWSAAALNSRRDTSRSFHMWCFSPGLAMQDFRRERVRSIILTSGTLSPLPSLAAELQTEFAVRLENPHVIEPHQVWVGVVPVGPSQVTLNSSYRNRTTDDYVMELGNTIANFCRTIPEGLLVFFPSYSVMESCISTWQRPASSVSGTAKSMWERMEQYKRLVVEAKGKHEFSQAIGDYETAIQQTSSGAAFFAVCRGKASEGLDFADAKGRAVIITGLPFAPVHDPKVRLKRQYMDDSSSASASASASGTINGSEWYRQQAGRAVNQAVGRVIRHRHDYGAIILCDERFGHPSTIAMLSVWVRPHVFVHQKFGEAQASLVSFFKRAQSDPLLAPATAPAAPPASQGADLASLATAEDRARGGGAPPSIARRDSSNTSAGDSSFAVSVAPTYRRQQQRQRDAPSPAETFFALQDSLLKATQVQLADIDEPSLALPTTSAKSLSNLRQAIAATKDGVAPPAPASSSLTAVAAAAKPAAAPSSAQRATAQSYYNFVKENVKGDAFAEFKAALVAFKKKQVSLTHLVGTLRRIFGPSPHVRALLGGFRQLIPEQQHANFDKACGADGDAPPPQAQAPPIKREASSSVPDTVPKKSRLHPDDIPRHTVVKSERPTAPAVEVRAAASSPLPVAVDVPHVPLDPDVAAGPFPPPPPPPAGEPPGANVIGAPFALSIDSPAAPPKQTPAASATAQVAQSSETSSVKSSGVCVVCREKLSIPFSAPCGHVGCYACWQTWLAVKLECPKCRSKTRAKQLQKLFF